MGVMSSSVHSPRDHVEESLLLPRGFMYGVMFQWELVSMSSSSQIVIARQFRGEEPLQRMAIIIDDAAKEHVISLITCS